MVVEKKFEVAVSAFHSSSFFLLERGMDYPPSMIRTVRCMSNEVILDKVSRHCMHSFVERQGRRTHFSGEGFAAVGVLALQRSLGRCRGCFGRRGGSGASLGTTWPRAVDGGNC